MTRVFTGNARLFGDHIDTDMIIPSRFLVTDDEQELGRSVFCGSHPQFAASVRPGDIIVAGRNFGCGSSREHAPLAIRGAGVACIVAASFARTFFRNCIDRGFYAIELPEATARFQEGDQIRVDIAAGQVSNLTRGTTYDVAPFPSFIRNLCESGGLFPFIQARLDALAARG